MAPRPQQSDENFSDVTARFTFANSSPMDSAGAYPGLGTHVGTARGACEDNTADRATERSR